MCVWNELKRNMKSHTRKNSWVEESRRTPYSISVCLAKSSAELIGEDIRSTVKKAAGMKRKKQMESSELVLTETRKIDEFIIKTVRWIKRTKNEKENKRSFAFRSV